MKLNDTSFILKKYKKSGTRRFGMLRYVEDSNLILGNGNLLKHLEVLMDSNKSNIVFFISEDISYNFYNAVLETFINSDFEKNRHINFIDSTNRIIKTRIPYRWRYTSAPVTIYHSNILEIFYNFDGQLMIENDWNRNFSDIKPMITEYYTNPANKESFPSMREFNKQLCVTNIAILKSKKESSQRYIEQNYLQKEIDKWQRTLNYVNLLGSFRKIPKSSFINIQMGSRNSMKDYVRIIDSINGAVVTLRNELSNNKFDKPYIHLNPADSLDKLRREAIEFVFPTIINPIHFFSYELPPPPPAIP